MFIKNQQENGAGESLSRFLDEYNGWQVHQLLSGYCLRRLNNFFLAFDQLFNRRLRCTVWQV